MRRHAPSGRAARCAAFAALLALAPLSPAAAFCGFYAAGAGADVFNGASKVVMTRHDDATTITMANDYIGDVEDFALVIPTPVTLRRDQIRIRAPEDVTRIDAFTAPRLVEYFDPDPCAPAVLYGAAESAAGIGGGERAVAPGPATRGVSVEAAYAVGAYDIVILSATESDGLAQWLADNGYETPEAARPILASYIQQGVKFFVARVNLDRAAASGQRFLSPLQISFESRRFMLPIRLGTASARGSQDLILMLLTRTGRVETANYRVERIATGAELPLYAQESFEEIYAALFERAVARSGGAGVFLEYAWDMAWCDPCAAAPLSPAELARLGVDWLPGDADSTRGVDVFVTRLHLRYDAERFPEDLRLIETGDRTNFQARYVTRRPFSGPDACGVGDEYALYVAARHERQAQTLADLTGWPLSDIRARIAASGQRLRLPLE